MNRQNSVKGEMQTPYNSTETDNDQRAVDKGTKANFAKLGSNTALEDVPDGMECRVIGVANEV